jgi:uncharacterized membrane protein
LPSEYLLNAATGAASGALADEGINDHFMKEFAGDADRSGLDERNSQPPDQ